jgi:hypothetical protein
MTELEKPTMVGKYHEENLNNPETNQVAVYHNKDGKSRIGKITDVGDTTVKIEGRFDIPKEVQIPIVRQRHFSLNTIIRWLEFRKKEKNKNCFANKSDK